MGNRYFRHRPWVVAAFPAEQDGVVVDDQTTLFYYNGDYVVTEEGKKRVMTKEQFERTYVEIYDYKEGWCPEKKLV
jgi:hypothetical protein